MDLVEKMLCVCVCVLVLALALAFDFMPTKPAFQGHLSQGHYMSVSIPYVVVDVAICTLLKDQILYLYP